MRKTVTPEESTVSEQVTTTLLKLSRSPLAARVLHPPHKEKTPLQPGVPTPLGHPRTAPAIQQCHQAPLAGPCKINHSSPQNEAKASCTQHPASRAWERGSQVLLGSLSTPSHTLGNLESTLLIHRTQKLGETRD